ncbi:potassium transporter Kef [Bordetella genomosp. 8]|uniref:Potassium transporter Kef n=1 Tax=Bordetella genomosp. 8 TaxID=1416806 RepID=A0A1W6YJU0_9BORD|nr:cation:proton antiporter [Bordetella genomosp. 8]ARP81301.1 potassium transporter Kef [Bordetella genomosp. 8]
MPHSTPLITTIVGGLVLAFILAALAVRLKLPPLIGYLCAGILCGPYTPGFTADSHLANELAELGVILLMFGVGLHFSLRDLLSVKHIAVPGAIVQIAAATAMGLGLSWMLGWNMGAGLLFGLALSVASTVVLIKAMEDRDLVETNDGRIAVGWLIVEDLAMVAALVLIPALSGVLGGREDNGANTSLWMILSLTALKVAAFVVVMLVIGRRVIPWLLERVVYTGNRELFRLGVLACALGIAYGATALFDVSFALGAFFAGMVMAESEFSQRAADESLPLRDAFSVLFFVSVGMLFDPMVLIRDPWGVLGTFLIIVVGKSIASYVIVRAFRHPKLTALTISASLAQIGEFSFILAGLGVSQEILPKAGQDLVLAGAILSILANPLLFNALDRYRSRLEGNRVRPEAPDPGV